MQLFMQLSRSFCQRQMQQGRMYQPRIWNMNICWVLPSMVNKFPPDTGCRPLSFQCQHLRMSLRGRVQSPRSMPFLQDSNGQQDMGCMRHSTQCPAQSTFQARKDPILKPWLCPQGNIARQDMVYNWQRGQYPALNKNRQDTSRRLKRLRSREDKTFRRDKGSMMRSCRCPGWRTTLEDKSPILTTTRNR